MKKMYIMAGFLLCAGATTFAQGNTGDKKPVAKPVLKVKYQKLPDAKKSKPMKLQEVGKTTIKKNVSAGTKK